MTFLLLSHHLFLCLSISVKIKQMMIWNNIVNCKQCQPCYFLLFFVDSVSTYWGWKRAEEGFSVLFSVCVTVCPSAGKEMNRENPIREAAGWVPFIWLEELTLGNHLRGRSSLPVPWLPPSPATPSAFLRLPLSSGPVGLWGLSLGAPAALSPKGGLTCSWEMSQHTQPGALRNSCSEIQNLLGIPERLVLAGEGTRPRMGHIGLGFVRCVYQSSRVILLKTGRCSGVEFPGWKVDGVCPPAPLAPQHY